MHRMPTHTHLGLFYRCSYVAKKHLWHQSVYGNRQNPDTIALIDMLCLTSIICTSGLPAARPRGTLLPRFCRVHRN